MKNLILHQSGIGDILIFLSFLQENFNKEIIVDFDIKNMEYWRTDAPEYYSFIHDLASFLAPPNVKCQKNLAGTLIKVEDIVGIYKFNRKPFKMIDLRHKFDGIKDSSHVVINTKVRDFVRNEFNAIKKDFYHILNESDKIFILQGEKEVEYGREYTIHGDQRIYSIYQDLIDNVNPEKIQDLTFPASGITTPIFSNLYKDLDIIRKHKVISFGISGMNYLCWCFSDMIGCYTERGIGIFIDEPHRTFKYKEGFIKDLPEFLN